MKYASFKPTQPIRSTTHTQARPARNGLEKSTWCPWENPAKPCSERVMQMDYTGPLPSGNEHFAHPPRRWLNFDIRWKFFNF
jgi:hypothetical protein